MQWFYLLLRASRCGTLLLHCCWTDNYIVDHAKTVESYDSVASLNVKEKTPCSSNNDY